jgi:hypothetical protein
MSTCRSKTTVVATAVMVVGGVGAVIAAYESITWGLVLLLIATLIAVAIAALNE